MKAVAIIDQVRSEGGLITIKGAEIILSAPKPLPPELVAQVREHKTDILRALDEISTLQAEFERTGRIRIESDWAGRVWLIASVNQRRNTDGGTVYSPDEIRFMVDLSESERRLLHGFKQRFGGTIEVKSVNKSSSQQQEDDNDDAIRP